jgi:phosphoribosylformylglycinamidine cyclo-ligase
MTQPSEPLTYADSGVDVDAYEATIPRIAEIARRASRPEVITSVGGFAGLFSLGQARARSGEPYRDPVLVAATDGVGTKVLIHAARDRYEDAGRDVVINNVNDLACLGAEPLFFLDYLATADLDPEARVRVLEGIGEACREHGMALLGGETAEMPDMYRPGDFDLAGFVVGVVERDELVDPATVEVGDALIALPSGGLMTNGYSLVREVWAIGKGLGVDHDRELLETTYEELGGTLGDALGVVHPSFVDALEAARTAVGASLHGVAHITGGGLPGNLPRILGDTLAAELDASSWTPPAIFDLIAVQGGIASAEMWRTFNMGAGMVLAVDEASATACLDVVEGAWRVGTVVERNDGAVLRGIPLQPIEGPAE